MFNFCLPSVLGVKHIMHILYLTFKIKIILYFMLVHFFIIIFILRELCTIYSKYGKMCVFKLSTAITINNLNNNNKNKYSNLIPNFKLYVQVYSIYLLPII